MRFLRLIIMGLMASAAPVAAQAQSADDGAQRLFLELNTLQDVGGACRLTFVATNKTGQTVDQAIFETVVFDTSGGVVTLSLFDFRDLPADRPRVRQFDLPGVACENVGQALINGANTCRVAGADSPVCHDALSLRSRLSVELLG